MTARFVKLACLSETMPCKAEIRTTTFDADGLACRTFSWLLIDPFAVPSSISSIGLKGTHISRLCLLALPPSPAHMNLLATLNTVLSSRSARVGEAQGTGIYEALLGSY